MLVTKIKYRFLIVAFKIDVLTTHGVWPRLEITGPASGELAWDLSVLNCLLCYEHAR